MLWTHDLLNLLFAIQEKIHDRNSVLGEDLNSEKL